MKFHFLGEVSNKEKYPSIDSIYEQKFIEMRRHRDYEIRASTWYTTILTSVIIGICILKFGTFNQRFFYSNADMAFLYFGINILVAILSFAGAHTVWYSNKRYQEIRSWMDTHMELVNEHKFSPIKHIVKPNQVIIFLFISIYIFTTILLWIQPIYQTPTCSPCLYAV